jgi:methyltransferase (TIGR00027 family)
MSVADGKILHVSDTALMVAACRALETSRPDGFVRDPFAERLAGERGMEILRALPRAEMMCFGIGVRSRFMDELVQFAVQKKAVTTVVSVGCGLDTRPWRLDLPSELRWIEVDFPEMIRYKSALMDSETPRCRVERVAADLNEASQRQAVWAAAQAGPGLVITEGLLMYLPGATVEALAAEPAGAGGIRYWLADITSPAFARAIGMDAFRDIQEMRATASLDGLQILSVMEKAGWGPVERRSYLTDVWAFGADRLRAAAEARKRAGMPESSFSVPPDDPTGVHLLSTETGHPVPAS